MVANTVEVMAAVESTAAAVAVGSTGALMIAVRRGAAAGGAAGATVAEGADSAARSAAAVDCQRARWGGIPIIINEFLTFSI